MIKINVLILLVIQYLLVSHNSFADSIDLDESVDIVASKSGKYFARFEIEEGVSLVNVFIYENQEYTLINSFNLECNNRPPFKYVSDNGLIATLGNSGGQKCKNDLIIYNDIGKICKKFRLNYFLSDNQVKKIVERNLDLNSHWYNREDAYSPGLIGFYSDSFLLIDYFGEEHVIKNKRGRTTVSGKKKPLSKDGGER